MANKRYFWLRLHNDFFDSVRIKKMRRMKDGDTLVVIYLKLQLKAISRDGMLTFRGLEDTFAEELALDIDESPENVETALQFMLKNGLCTMSKNTMTLPYAIENTGSETASTQRSRECRERAQMLQCNANVLQRNTSATQVQHKCNAEKEIHKEKYIYISTPDVVDMSETAKKYYRRRLEKYEKKRGVVLPESTIEEWYAQDCERCGGKDKLEEKIKASMQEKIEENFDADEFFAIALEASKKGG